MGCETRAAVAALPLHGKRCGVDVGELAELWPNEYRFQVPDELRDPLVDPCVRAFTASSRCEAFLTARGFSYGSHERGAPAAVFAGDCEISKWRHLSARERREADGLILGALGGTGRGDVVLRMREPIEGAPVFVPVPVVRWGKDHWSTLAYVETRTVDHRGTVRLANLRVDPDRHPLYIERGMTSHGKHPCATTRLREPAAEIVGHDDWDCIEDMEAAGLLLRNGTEEAPGFRLTDLGAQVAADLRAFKGRGGSFGTFTWKPAPPALDVGVWT